MSWVLSAPASYCIWASGHLRRDKGVAGRPAGLALPLSEPFHCFSTRLRRFSTTAVAAQHNARRASPCAAPLTRCPAAAADGSRGRAP
ncbi:hypothetical protein E2C01_059490 [Portunus trituberculatus]|uniref:Uncharacterized protein n=1 Tax=Portunus trituberculatus TaxID=210409 RepID=A0A5B7H600_PORTR|nr:hypothetical protein [Portunus trituberculatus]